MIYFTSDEHHLHEAIIDYCCRPFTKIADCTQKIIDNHNNLVTGNDTVIHLGDFSYSPESISEYGTYVDKILAELKNIMQQYKKVKERILIIGNHDEFSRKEYKEIGFDTVFDYTTIGYKDTEFFLCHDPSFYQPKIYHRVAICGHVHNLFRTIPGRQIYNASVDINNFCPVSIDQVLITLKSKRAF